MKKTSDVSILVELQKQTLDTTQQTLQAVKQLIDLEKERLMVDRERLEWERTRLYIAAIKANVNLVDNNGVKIDVKEMANES